MNLPYSASGLRRHLEEAGTDTLEHARVCRPRVRFNPRERSDFGIFLGHGFSSSAIFDGVISRLEEDDIPYYCPRLTGFGTLNTDIPRHVARANWEADIVEGLEVLEQACREIAFVGYSVSGTMLHRLIGRPTIRSIHLVNPDIFFNSGIESGFKVLFGLPGRPVARLVELLGGWFERERSNERRCVDVVDPERSNAAFDYTHASVCMLEALSQLGEATASAIRSNRVDKPVHLYLGGQSRYLDLFQTIEAFHALEATKAIHYYPRSGHMLPLDSEAPEFIRDLLDAVRAPDADAMPAAPDVSPLTMLERTSFVPLKSRVVSALDPAQRYTDPAAVAMYLRLGLHGLAHEPSLANVARTRLFDELATSCTRDRRVEHVVNLGVGLCTRMARLEGLPVRWYDVDTEGIIELRTELFETFENHGLITGSVLEDEWMSSVPSGEPVLFVAEGLFLFLEETEVERLVARLKASFPESYVLFDSYSRRLLQEKYHRRLVDLGIRFQSGIDDVRAFADAAGGRILDSKSIFAARDLPWTFPVSLLRRVPSFRNMARVTLMQL